MPTQPTVTVAAVVERNGLFLMVEERVDDRLVINQPAGHLESGESLVDAVVRETREETGWTFVPQGLVGIYRWTKPSQQTTYVRVCFFGSVTTHDAGQPLDTGIERASWLSRSDLIQRSAELRSPMVLRCLDDFSAGKHFPLEALVDLA
jgi:8-oxo-dGTP pyrophosphatase MutT (NUDIX family)